jgi:hypothetical protein
MTPEDVEQQKFYMWFNNMFCLATKKPRYLIFSVPNSGKDKKEQSHKKFTGLLPGVSDLIIDFGVLLVYCEMKIISGGVQSPKQKEFEQRVKELGRIYIICEGFEDAKEKITNIMIEYNLLPL